MKLSVGKRCWLLLLGWLLCVAPAYGGDWPQILGPNRDGRAVNEKLRETWPDGGPQRLWTVPLGSGYGGAAVQGGKVVVFHRVGDQERVDAFGEDGIPIWQRDFPATYRGGFNADNGPRCTPVIDGDQVFVFGAAGDLHCLTLANGRPQWSRSLFADYKAQEGYFGAGSTPIVVGDLVLVNVGGRGAGLVALNRATGKTIWKRTDEGASYSSPTEIQLAGSPAAVFITRYNCVALRPKTGEELFRFAFGKRGPTVNAATPLFMDGSLFVSSSYGVGAKAARVSSKGAIEEELWANDSSMSSQYATAVHANGYLYGCHGREDIGQAEFRCVDLKSGKVRWALDGFGVAHVIAANDLLLTQSNDGRLTLLRADPKEPRKLAEAKVSRGTTRAIPALSNGRLYIRENNGPRGALVCLKVGE